MSDGLLWQLNEDCLVNIFKFLSYHDLLAMADTCDKLQEAVQIYLRQDPRYWSMLNDRM